MSAFKYALYKKWIKLTNGINTDFLDEAICPDYVPNITAIAIKTIISTIINIGIISTVELPLIPGKVATFIPDVIDYSNKYLLKSRNNDSPVLPLNLEDYPNIPVSPTVLDACPCIVNYPVLAESDEDGTIINPFVIKSDNITITDPNINVFDDFVIISSSIILDINIDILDPSVIISDDITARTAPDNIIKQTIAIPETTMPDDVIYETTMPDDVIYETTMPEDVIYETTLPEDVIYETTLPEDVMSNRSIARSLLTIKTLRMGIGIRATNANVQIKDSPAYGLGNASSVKIIVNTDNVYIGGFSIYAKRSIRVVDFANEYIGVLRSLKIANITRNVTIPKLTIWIACLIANVWAAINFTSSTNLRTTSSLRISVITFHLLRLANLSSSSIIFSIVASNLLNTALLTTLTI